MLSGIQEILVIILILIAILFVPRMISPQRRAAPKPFHPLHSIRNLSVRWRLAIVVSLLWLLGSAVYLRPWQKTPEPFLFLGCGPVFLGWCITWVVAGFGKRKKN
jgi:uncharacterized BrkB/YihY/UPF0761 family membrane protein